MSHSHDSRGVTTPLLTNIVPLTGVWIAPFRTTPLKIPDESRVETSKRSGTFRSAPFLTSTRNPNLYTKAVWRGPRKHLEGSLVYMISL